MIWVFNEDDMIVEKDCEDDGDIVCLLPDLESYRASRRHWPERARLIAASPKLLAALKLLVADVAQYEAWQRPCYALDEANAAIWEAGG